MGVIVRWLLKAGKYSRVSGSMVDMGCYCKVVALDR